MLPLLMLASLPVMLNSSAAGAQDASAQVVREAKNGEFISANYPPGALKRGEQGRVAFRLTIEPDGSLGACVVTESSGFQALDRETCEIMVANARLQPMRNADGRRIRATTNGYIVWRLPSGATAQLASATSGTMPKPNKIICKRTQTTGSLIAKTKQCMTRTEWVRTETQYRQQMEEIQGKGNGPQGN